MDKDLEKYYEARFSMFASKGWEELMEDVQEMHDSTNTLEGIKTEAELQFRKGELSIIKWLLNLSSISREAFDSIKDDK